MIWFLTTAATEVLALRTASEALPDGFPPVRAGSPYGTDVDLDGATCVLVRLLGGRRAWEDGFDELRAECLRRGHPVPRLRRRGRARRRADRAVDGAGGTVTEAFALPGRTAGRRTSPPPALRGRHRAARGLRLRAAGRRSPTCRCWRRPAERDPARPLVGVVFYRAHLVAGNTQLRRRPVRRASRPRGADAAGRLVLLAARRRRRDPVVELLARRTASTCSSPPCWPPAAWPRRRGLAGGAGGLDGEAWDVSGARRARRARHPGAVVTAGSPSSGATPTPASARSTSRRASPSPSSTAASSARRSPSTRWSTTATSSASPVTAYRTVPDRAARVAGLAVRHARLRRTPPADSAGSPSCCRPTRPSAAASATPSGLDTPASAIRPARTPCATPATASTASPTDGDALMAELADGLTYDAEQLTPAQLDAARRSPAPSSDYADVVRHPARRRCGTRSRRAWGPAPGRQRVHDGDARVQRARPRQRARRHPAAPRLRRRPDRHVYHSPDLPPPHHYLAFYRWLDEGWGADAIVHLGKHGTLEWLPGKALGALGRLLPRRRPRRRAVLLPVRGQRPGRGHAGQAPRPRRGHRPPAAADDPGRHLRRPGPARAAARRVRPGRSRSTRPSCRRSATRSGTLLAEPSIDRDLGLGDVPDDDDFDDVIVHVDGYLCALKDAQIRGGLHILGDVPEGEALVDLVLAITRLPPGRGAVAAGHRRRRARHRPRRRRPRRHRPRRGRVPRAASRRSPRAGWDADRRRRPDAALGRRRGSCPTCARTPDELANLLAGLAGRHVPAGPERRADPRRRPRAADRPQLLLASTPRRMPVAAGVGGRARSWPTRCSSATSTRTGTLPAHRRPGAVGHRRHAHPGRRRRRGPGPARRPARCGTPESRRVVGLEVDPARRARPAPHRRHPAHLRLLPRRLPPPGRTCSTTPSRWSAALDEPRRAELRARRTAPTTPGSSGPPPGGYGSGILAAARAAHVAHRRRPRRGLPRLVRLRLRPRRLRRRRRRRDAPPLRRHRGRGQEPGQPRARHLRLRRLPPGPRRHGRHRPRRSPARDPKAWFGDSADPADPQVRSLAEEAARVVRTRVLNPKWIDAMRRHGYKGAFEMAATVDYLFGYDATAHVVEDWMYERVTEAYVADPDDAEVLRAVEPVGAARRSPSACSRRTSAACGTPRRGRSPTLRRRRARGRGLGGAPMSRTLPVLRRRRPGRRQAGAAARRRRPAHRRRAAAGRQGLGQDHAGPRPGRAAARRRAVRRAAPRRHRGPGRRHRSTSPPR